MSISNLFSPNNYTLYCGDLISNNISSDNINDCSNEGTGAEIFDDIVQTGDKKIAYFRTLTQGPNVIITQNTTDITIAATTGGGGGVDAGQNNGGGDAIFQEVIGNTMNFKTLLAGTNVSFTDAPNTITINSIGGGGGTITGGQNNGGGDNIFQNVTSGIMNFKTLVAGSNISFTDAPNTITINGTGGGAGVTSFNSRTGNVVSTKADYSMELLTDTNIVSPTNGQFISYNSGQWINSSVSPNQNIYNTDGTLQSNRIVEMANKTLTFNDGAGIIFNSGIYENPISGNPSQNVMTTNSSGVSAVCYYMSNNNSWKGQLPHELTNYGDALIFYKTFGVNVWNMKVYASTGLTTDLTEDLTSLSWTVKTNTSISGNGWFIVPPDRGNQQYSTLTYQLECLVEPNISLQQELSLRLIRTESASPGGQLLVTIDRKDYDTNSTYFNPMIFSPSNVPSVINLYEKEYTSTFQGFNTSATFPTFTFNYHTGYDLFISYAIELHQVGSGQGNLNFQLGTNNIFATTYNTGSYTLSNLTETNLNASSLLVNDLLLPGVNSITLNCATNANFLNTIYCISVIQRI
jgi:hypothetical protein